MTPSAVLISTLLQLCLGLGWRDENGYHIFSSKYVQGFRPKTYQSSSYPLWKKNFFWRKRRHVDRPGTKEAHMAETINKLNISCCQGKICDDCSLKGMRIEGKNDKYKRYNVFSKYLNNDGFVRRNFVRPSFIPLHPKSPLLSFNHVHGNHHMHSGMSENEIEDVHSDVVTPNKPLTSNSFGFLRRSFNGLAKLLDRNKSFDVEKDLSTYDDNQDDFENKEVDFEMENDNHNLDSFIQNPSLKDNTDIVNDQINFEENIKARNGENDIENNLDNIYYTTDQEIKNPKSEHDSNLGSYQNDRTNFFSDEVSGSQSHNIDEDDLIIKPSNQKHILTKDSFGLVDNLFTGKTSGIKTDQPTDGFHHFEMTDFRRPEIEAFVKNGSVASKHSLGFGHFAEEKPIYFNTDEVDFSKNAKNGFHDQNFGDLGFGSDLGFGDDIGFGDDLGFGKDLGFGNGKGSMVEHQDEGYFVDHPDDCDGITTKTCLSDADCSCYGSFFCSNAKCEMALTQYDENPEDEGQWWD